MVSGSSSPDTKFFARVIFLAPKQTLLVADNVINAYNYPIYWPPYVRKHVPVFVVGVSRPYFSTSPQGASDKFGLETKFQVIQNFDHK